MRRRECPAHAHARRVHTASFPAPCSDLDASRRAGDSHARLPPLDSVRSTAAATNDTLPGRAASSVASASVESVAEELEEDIEVDADDATAARDDGTQPPIGAPSTAVAAVLLPFDDPTSGDIFGAGSVEVARDVPLEILQHMLQHADTAADCDEA